ncbi:MAG: hypothetical protein OXT65_02890 [Alphaproteobacteria bacterium]|nr:hypothetical protein [Alphaproteobacteria bacterium]
MVSESVIIFGATGNVVMVLNDALPKDMPLLFKVGHDTLDLVSGEDVIYSEQGLNNYTCQRLRQKNEIGILEVLDKAHPPKHLTNVAYQAEC